MLNLDYLRRNNKKILAFFGVFLMIAFILPSYTKSGRDYQKGEFGRAYGEVISIGEHRRAMDSLRMMKEQLRDYMYLSLAQRLLGATGNVDGNQLRRALAQNRLVDRTAGQIIEKLDPINFALLLREARRMNVTVSKEQVETLLDAIAPPKDDVESTSDVQIWRKQAVTDWMTVLGAFDRMAEVPRMSPAMAAWGAANVQQQVSLQLVDFRALDFEKAAGKPTEAQLTAFFKEYENKDRDTSEKGVGYRFPKRVRLQYVKISRSRVLESVDAQQSADYWVANKSQFVALPEQPASQPSSQPATRSAMVPSSKPSSKPATLAASTQPTTRQWAEGNDVDKEIREMLANQRMWAIAKAVQQRMSAEWPNFNSVARAQNKAIPDNAPNTDYGVPYQSFAFLRRVSEKVQTMKDAAGVLPEAVEMDRLYAAGELKDLTDIGKASLGGGLNVPEYVTTFVEPFLTDQVRKQATNVDIPMVRILEPLKAPAQDAAGNLYVLRALAAESERPARDLNEVRVQAERDWVAIESMKKAREAAEKFLALAKSKGVAVAAKEQGIEGKVVQTELFHNEPSEKIGKYELSDVARKQLIEGAFGLLQQRVRTGEEHPAGIIELPRAQRVIAAQLLESKPASGGFELDFFAMQMQGQYSFRQTAKLAHEWFDMDSLHKRTQYDAGSRKGKGGDGE